ncbi:MAG: GxGYxYP family putative glycoside hydrolase [Capsulimonadaceae bacterium]|nr:GxGYxYP family putative glycoside hydrolase [Capsulimonadaceae bacterium]
MTFKRLCAMMAVARQGALTLFAVALALWAALGAANAVAYQQSPTIPPTVYTYDLTPTRNYDWSSDEARNNAWAEVHLVAALQGLVNRGYARLYTTYVTSDPRSPGNIDNFWFNVMRAKGGWIENSPLETIDSIEDLAIKFRPYYNGVVVYDLRVPATSNVASTAAGCEKLLPIPYDPRPGSVYSRLVTGGPKLPVCVRLVNENGSSLFTGSETGSAKCDAYLWAKRRYLDTGLCDPKFMAYYVDSWALTGGLKKLQDPYERFALINHDYFISKRAFFFDLSPWSDERPQDDPDQPTGADYRTLISIFDSATHTMTVNEIEHKTPPSPITIGGFIPWAWKYTATAGGSNHEAVATEWRFTAIASCYNACLDADALQFNAMANATFFAHYPLRAKYPQNRPSEQDWYKAGYVDKRGHIMPWTYVTVYSGDYDSAAWLYQKLPTMWLDPARGTVPLGWPFNPNLSDRFPLGFDWARTTASKKDYFLAGDSGAGYLNPGFLDGDRSYSALPSGVDLWAKYCAPYYNKFDLTITDVIDGDAAPMSAATMAAYARFSPGGILAQKTASPYSLIPGTKTPLVAIEGDLPSTNDGADAVAMVKARTDNDTGGGPHFHAFRTVLWTPSQHLKVFNQLEAVPKIVVVDPVTFMALLKLHLDPPNKQ